MQKRLRKKVVEVALFTIVGCLSSVHGNETMAPTLGKGEAVFVFDAHGVLLNFDYTKLGLILGVGATATSIVAALLGWKPAVAMASVPAIGWGTFGLWYFWYKAYYGQSPCVESFLQGDALFKKMLLRTWLFFANLFTPNKQMFDLAWKLKEQGYAVMLASNIGKTALAELEQKYPAFFVHGEKSLFDVVFQPGCDWAVAREDAHRFDGGWLVKTSQSYFDGLFDFVQKRLPLIGRHLIFIDDNKRFVERAKKLNDGRLRPLLFKSFDDLCTQLKQIGLRLEKE